MICFIFLWKSININLVDQVDHVNTVVYSYLHVVPTELESYDYVCIYKHVVRQLAEKILMNFSG